jgi:hypothetical protein
MGSIQWETRPSIQREDQLTMETKLEQIAAKARCEPKLRFTSLAHHISRDRVWRNLSQIPKWSAAGVDGQTVEAAKKSFDGWIEPMLQSIHRQGYRAPDIRRVYIPKPGKTEKRPLGVPTVADRALQRSTAEVLSAIYEQDFLPCSFGGRPKLSAHHALATLNEVIAGGKIGWVLGVICFQYRSDAIRVQDALRFRLGKFGLTLEPTKTKLVEFGRFAQRHAGKRGRKRPETIYFLGLTLYCTRNLKGNFKVGMRTEKSRLRRSLLSLQELTRRIRHDTISDQVGEINAFLRGHYAYYGVAGNLRCLVKVYRAVERYWHRMLRSRSWAGRRLTWEKYHQIKARMPLLKPKLRLPYAELQALAVL